MLWIQLGPLPTAEAALYIRSHPKLRALLFSDQEGLKLVRRVMDISRGHPLIMNRLAALADNRPALAQALDALENTGWRSLPDLFAPTTSASDRERERKYLEDVAIGSVDFLIERLTPDARRLLWIITQANEPVTADLLEGVWSDKTVEDEQLEKIRMFLRLADQLPEELRPQIPEIPPELKALIEQAPTPDPSLILLT